MCVLVLKNVSSSLFTQYQLRKMIILIYFDLSVFDAEEALYSLEQTHKQGKEVGKQANTNVPEGPNCCKNILPSNESIARSGRC